MWQFIAAPSTRIWRNEHFCHKMEIIFSFCCLRQFKNVTFVILVVWESLLTAAVSESNKSDKISKKRPLVVLEIFEDFKIFAEVCYS